MSEICTTDQSIQPACQDQFDWRLLTSPSLSMLVNCSDTEWVGVVGALVLSQLYHYTITRGQVSRGGQATLLNLN